LGSILLPAVTAAFDHQRVATNVDGDEDDEDDVPCEAAVSWCVEVHPATDAAITKAADATPARRTRCGTGGMPASVAAITRR
jgi:hypothetical protein